MRPDLEDYEDLTTDEAPRSRAMSWLVLAIAVGGFAALAYYAYHSGDTPAREGELMLVAAEEGPIKQTPADPEGEQFANKDKTIYDVIAPNAGAEGANVEKLLPEPEKPVLDARSTPGYIEESQAAAAIPAAPASPTTFVNKDVVKPDAAIDPVDVQSLKQPAPAPVVTPAPQVPAATQPGEPKFVNESPATAKKPEPVKAAEPAKKEVKEAKEVKETKAPAKAAASSGSYQIQLGAFKSEDEARGAWKKAVAKSASVLTGSPTVVKADLPNGTFYRLRTGGYASADAAKAACAKLAAQKQACIPVGK